MRERPRLERSETLLVREASEPAGLGSSYVLLTIGLVTFAAFAPALWNGFVDWDDGYLFVVNPHWRGLGWSQIRWMFTTPLLENYVPIAWLTLGFDYVLWGMRPVGYHLTNVLLHTASAVLLYPIASRLLQRATRLRGGALRAGAVTAALFFSLHPLRVESVAWISERRDVLSGLLFLATILFYLDATEASGARRRRRLLASLATYALAVGSKVLVVTLPLTLVLLDVYPLQRLPLDPRRWFDRAHRALWMEKVPYVVLGAAGATTAYLILHHDGAVRLLALPEALGKAAFALWFHFQKTVVPIGLSPMYELPARIDPLASPFIVAEFGTLCVTVVALLLVRVWPAGLVVWAHHVIVLGPVSGIAHAGFQLTADRFSYLAGPAWALLAGAGAGMLVQAAQGRGQHVAAARLGALLASVWLLSLGALSWQQTQVWRSTETLWRAALRESPDCAVCHATFGRWLMRHGQESAGLHHLRQAALLRPDRPMSFGWVGQAHAQRGHFPEAIAAYREELAIRPMMIEARTGLGGVLLRAGRPAEALAELELALAQSPDTPAVRTNLGIALLEVRRAQDAVPHLLAAIALDSRDGVPRLALANAYLALGDRYRAREQYDALRELDPALAARLAGRIDAAAQPR